MPQKSYTVELPSGASYTVELPDAQKSHPIREFGSGYVSEPIDQAKDIGHMLSTGAPDPASSMGGAVGSAIGHSAKGRLGAELAGLKSQPDLLGVLGQLSRFNPLTAASDVVRGAAKDLSAVDPSGVSQSFNRPGETTAKKSGRAAFNLSLLGAPMLLKGVVNSARAGKIAKIAEAAKAAEASDAAAEAARYGGETQTATQVGGLEPPPIGVKSVQGGAVTGPNVSQMAEVKPKITPPSGTAAIDNPMPSQPVNTMRGVTGPNISMSVPVKPKPPVKGAKAPTPKAAPSAEPPVVPPVEPPRVNVETPPVEVAPPIATANPNNPAMKVEAQADALGNRRLGGGKGYTGPERRLSPESLAAMEKEMAEKAGATRAEAEAQLVAQQADRLNPTEAARSVPEGAGIAEPSLPMDKLEDALRKPQGPGRVIRIGYGEKGPAEPPVAPQSAGGAEGAPVGAAPPEGKPASPGPVLGGPRKPPQASPEVVTRLAGGETLNEIAIDLRRKLGSDKAAKAMGLTKTQVLELAPGPSQIPTEAAAKIKTALEAKIANGTATKAEQTLFDRIKGEGGAVDLKKLLVLGGGVTGGVIGASLPSDPDTDQDLINTALGVLGGAALPAIALNPAKAVHVATQGWVDSLLSGGAVLKNVAQSAGAAPIAALENIGAKEKLPSNPVMQQLRLPTRTKEFLQAWKKPSIGLAQSDYADKVNFPAGRTISAIDTQTRRGLHESGLNTAELDRHMLTENNPFSIAMGNSGPINNPVSRGIFKFTKIPINLVMGGLQETAQMLGMDLPALTKKLGLTTMVEPEMPHVNPAMRRGITAASIIGGGLSGDWINSGATADEKKWRARVAMIAAAALGRRGLPFAAAASLPKSIKEKTGLPFGGAPMSTAVGSLSPVPELGLHPQGLLQWPYASAIKYWDGLINGK